MAQTMDDEQQLHALLARTREPWLRADVDAIVDLAIGAGYGYRTRAARVPYRDSPDGRERLHAWYDSLEYIRLVPGDTNVLIDDDVAIVYGSFNEEFQHKGQEPEVVTVRFSSTAVKRDGEWRFIWAHRDAQVFDESGRYVRAPAVP